MKRVWIYPGSFDPFTLGHKNVAMRAARLCDELIVSVMVNRAKQGVFSEEERVDMARKTLRGVPGVRVISDDGLLVKLMQREGALAVVRGLRSESDFRFEAELYAANKLLDQKYEVLLFPCRPDLAFTSSSIVREVASFNGDISGMVDAQIVDQIRQKLEKKR